MNGIFLANNYIMDILFDSSKNRFIVGLAINVDDFDGQSFIVGFIEWKAYAYINTCPNYGLDTPSRSRQTINWYCKAGYACEAQNLGMNWDLAVKDSFSTRSQTNKSALAKPSFVLLLDKCRFVC
ncbi:hypothetical protein COCSADRAFT_219849 [Bipolaris sorokiniana ND90Pr]|uniref:Uncharacterized protein n=1 Tax=Cochliobolus sativus (strain ND90Pr / ATCC 201652) TaxID=665912 RepID=M2R5A2_COCSN|nr:uncharacterized protein COCSADRAFT_219849 [Bipolaris sorokiniana ND90Pr]EMD62344.1 hypothetical protein COCSADRAFT_219849 [Bipolaris sorokiniana ND90Pr]